MGGGTSFIPEEITLLKRTRTGRDALPERSKSCMGTGKGEESSSTRQDGKRRAKSERV